MDKSGKFNQDFKKYVSALKIDRSESPSSAPKLSTKTKQRAQLRMQIFNL